MIFSRSRKAFTLIESLIVIFILVVLVIIIAPAVSDASRKAAQVKCLNNLRQVTTGLLAFVVENRGNFINCYDVERDPVTNTPIRGVFWGGRLYHGGYVGSPDVFFCPSAKPQYWLQTAYAAGLRRNFNDSAWSYVSYSANRYGVMPSFSDGIRPARRADIQSPSETLLLIEGSNPLNPSQYDGLEWLSSASAAAVGALIREGKETDMAGPARRHGHSANVAYMDGRVEMVSLANHPVTTFNSASNAPWYEFVYTLD